MKPPVRRGKVRLFRSALLAALCAPQCVDSIESDGADAGVGGDAAIPSSGGSIDQGGETFGPTLICGKRTKISECDPLDLEACGDGQICDHAPEFGGFKCYQNPQPAGLGESCDGRSVKCGPGLSCELYALLVCQHYCCSDSDCDVGKCFGGYNQDGEATLGHCFGEEGGLCLFEDPADLPEDCLEPSGSAGAGGSAP